MDATSIRSSAAGLPLARLATLALVALAVLACDDSGPVEDVFLIEGELAYQGSVEHSLVTANDGIARIQVLELTPRLVDITVGASITIGLGVGQAAANEPCQTTFRTNARAGNVFSVGFDKDTEYCFRIFDPGTLPEDALIDYSISVSPG